MPSCSRSRYAFFCSWHRSFVLMFVWSLISYTIFSMPWAFFFCVADHPQGVYADLGLCYNANILASLIPCGVAGHHSPCWSRQGRTSGGNWMKKESKCFHHRELCYDGQVAFTKLDSAEILRIKKSAFATANLPLKLRG